MLCFSVLQRGFNPRSRTGSDEKPEAIAGFHAVSIHAPARGATFALGDKFTVDVFQSTLPHGERQG